MSDWREADLELSGLKLTLLFDGPRVLKEGGGSRVVTDTERGMPANEMALDSVVEEGLPGGVLAALLTRVFDGAEIPLFAEKFRGLIRAIKSLKWLSLTCSSISSFSSTY